MSSPLLSKAGMKLAQLGIKWHLPIKGIIKNTIFHQFCGGETLEEAAETAAILQKFNVSVALDYGVEGKTSERDFDLAVPEFIKAIQYAATQPSIPFIPIKITGFAAFRLLEKIHEGQNLNTEETDAWKRVQVRIDQICAAAAQKQIMILIDAEESWIQKPVDELADTMMARYNQRNAIVYNTFQMYRHDRLTFLEASFEKAQKQGYILGSKLVRGAYMEKERARAKDKNYPDPIQPDKASSDQDYDAAVSFCLQHLDQMGLFIGTHNEASCMKAVEQMNQANIPQNHPNVWFAQLYGMSDNITFNLANEGFQVAKYLPYGPVSDVIPYLMRRAQENTSVAGQTSRELMLIKKEMKRRGLHRF